MGDQLTQQVEALGLEGKSAELDKKIAQIVTNEIIDTCSRLTSHRKRKGEMILQQQQKMTRLKAKHEKAIKAVDTLLDATTEVFTQNRESLTAHMNKCLEEIKANDEVYVIGSDHKHWSTARVKAISHAVTSTGTRDWSAILVDAKGQERSDSFGAYRSLLKDDVLLLPKSITCGDKQKMKDLICCLHGESFAVVLD